MTADADSLIFFYSSPLGELVRRVLVQAVLRRWPIVKGLTVVGIGFGLPFLEPLRQEARSCVILMPGYQGAVVWPQGQLCLTTLVEPHLLPLADASVDRLLIVHALESAAQPDTLLNEAWRILSPEARVIVITPSRGGIWTRTDRTPFGHGLPYSRGQLRDLFHHCLLLPTHWEEALYAPPFGGKIAIRSAPTVERLCGAFNLPFAGVHIVEAVKQLYRPADTRARSRSAIVLDGSQLLAGIPVQGSHPVQRGSG